jgi:hypothetical protein
MAHVMRSTPPTGDLARSSATPTGARVARVVLHWLLVAAALGYSAYHFPHLVLSASAGAVEFADLRWGWVAAAVASNLAAVYAESHRELLRVGGARVPVSTAQSITFAENAISNTVPVVGGAGAVAYAISRFRRRGVDAALASWAVLLSGVLSAIYLIALASIALDAVGPLPVLGAGHAVLAVWAVGLGAWMLVTRHPRSPTAASDCAQIEYRRPGHLPATATDVDQLPRVETPGRGPGVDDSARHLPVQADRADGRVSPSPPAASRPLRGKPLQGAHARSATAIRADPVLDRTGDNAPPHLRPLGAPPNRPPYRWHNGHHPPAAPPTPQEAS